MIKASFLSIFLLSALRETVKFLFQAPRGTSATIGHPKQALKIQNNLYLNKSLINFKGISYLDYSEKVRIGRGRRGGF